MKALVEKEIRMLLPAFAGALALAVLPVWLLPTDRGNDGGMTSWLYLFGTVMLALSSFGRELGLKTVPLILAQPLDRSRIWWTKIAVLGACAALTYDAWWLSGNVGSVFQPDRSIKPEVLGYFGLFAVVFMAGSLWLTLLLRQMAAAFWLAILIPLVMALVLHLLGSGDGVIFSGLGIYALTAFFLARRQFLCLQDTAWTGGVISLVSRKEAVERTVSRGDRPWGALIRKELRLHEFTLAGIAVLFLLHLGVVALRKFGAHTFGDSTLSALDMFGVVWLFVPLVAGSQSAAEERQLGILDGLLCLPVSRRLQFWIKLVFVVIIGGVLSCSLLWMIEAIAHGIGITKDFGVLGTGFKFSSAFLVFAALSLIGFYASTLTQSVLQAMAAGVVISLMLIGLLRLGLDVPRMWEIGAIPSLVVAIIWLAYGNFRWVFESGRRWRRNIFGITVVMAITLVLTEALNHRIWEYAMPVDGPHGPARLHGELQWSMPSRLPGPGKLPTNKPLAIHGYGGTGLAVVLPDGRLWTDRIVYDHGWLSLAGDQFVPGTNWVDGFADSRDTVAIRADGTLWVSEKPRSPWVRGRYLMRERHPLPEPPVPLVQFGMASNWQSVILNPTLLLKRDGTLWTWGTNNIDNEDYKGLRSFTPQLLPDPTSNWERIMRGSHWTYAWKRDGSAWAVEAELSNDKKSTIQLPALDHVKFRNLNRYPSVLNVEIGVREDGTLWYWRLGDSGYWEPNPRLEQVGKESDWAAVGSANFQIVALKTDGSLWSWKLSSDVYPAKVEALQEAPRRIGTHGDWLAFSWCENQMVALSADGTFWRVPPGMEDSWEDDDSRPWLAPSRRMSKIENIFGSKN